MPSTEPDEQPMPELSGAMNILTASASLRWVGGLFRRFFWCYIQAERREIYPSGNGQRSIVVEHDTWSKIFGCYPLGRRPIDMRIYRFRSHIKQTVSVYVIGEPLREVPTFEVPDEIPDVFPDLKSAKRRAATLVKAMRQYPDEKRKELAMAELRKWRSGSKPTRKLWDTEKS